MFMLGERFRLPSSAAVELFVGTDDLRERGKWMLRSISRSREICFLFNLRYYAPAGLMRQVSADGARSYCRSNLEVFQDVARLRRLIDIGGSWHVTTVDGRKS